MYWIAPNELLEAEGFEVLLVDTRQLAQAPGRNKKADAEDSQWIQRLQERTIRGLWSRRPRGRAAKLFADALHAPTL